MKNKKGALSQSARMRSFYAKTRQFINRRVTYFHVIARQKAEQ
jgi:hypothetical protein